VKASAVAFVVLAATVLIIHLLGGGFGNHMRH
jgi:hypothetical protein